MKCLVFSQRARLDVTEAAKCFARREVFLCNQRG